MTGSEYRTITLSTENYIFSCGQYLDLIHSSGKKIPLSIASTPRALPNLRLVFKPESNNPDSQLLEKLIQEKVVKGSSAKGKVRYPENKNNLLLIAKGTGISQALGILEHSKETQAKKNITLLWVNQKTEEATVKDCFDVSSPNVDFHGLDEKELSAWIGQNTLWIKNANCIATGDPEFVYLTKNEIDRNHISLSSFQSDVLEYVPQ